MKMRTSKNYLYLLLLGIMVSLSACEGLNSTNELEPGITSADVVVVTCQPEIIDKQVTLNASIEVDVDRLGQQLVWGFMWFEDNGTAERDVQKLTIGRGFHSGAYKAFKDDFPSGKQIAYCAFVDFKASPNAEVEQILGEEFRFEAR